MRVDGAVLPGGRHDFPFTASAAAKTWIEYHLFGVPTNAPGCQ